MRSALLAGIAMLATAACNGIIREDVRIQPSGTNSQRGYEVAGFERVSLAGPYRVIVTVGGQPSARAEGDSALLEHTEIMVDGNRLKIKLQEGYDWTGDRQATIYVTAPALTEADIAGSGDINVSAFQSARFEGSIAGSGNLNLELLQAQEARFDISGSGNITAAGTAREARVDIAGSGNALLDGFQSETARISIAGSGNADLNTTGTADISIAGSGNANIRGGARCQVSSAGSGTANCG